MFYTIQKTRINLLKKIILIKEQERKISETDYEVISNYNKI